MSISIISSESILGAQGELGKRLQDFSVRDAQLTMARAIEEAIASSGTLFVEAGTGTGKTFAYLVPSILSGKKTIISTGTKNLQDQLFQKDLPILKQFLPNTSALLKGRANYLCLHRLELTLSQGVLYDRQAVFDLEKIKTWQEHTRTGDIAECADIPEDSSIWPQVTSTQYNCLGQECPLYDRCYVVKARKKAMVADVVVVNHHLFFADLAIKEEGFGEILPGADVIIFDEAHQLPEIASRFFSTTFSSKQLTDLSQDLNLARLKEANDATQLEDACLRLEKSVMDMRLCFGLEPKREAWRAPTLELKKAIELISVELDFLIHLLDELRVRGPALMSAYHRAKELSVLFKQVTVSEAQEGVHWFETFAKSFMIHLTPITIHDQLKTALEKKSRALILTSATLTVDGQFSYLMDHIGLSDAKTLALESPFDYQQQALLYLPKNMPDPAHAAYTENLLEAVLPVIQACRGRTFILFTSHHALKTAALYLKAQSDFKLFVQGDKQKQQLLKDFIREDQAVLLGTYSFWEGVDVRGDALSCVIIDKLPFFSPKDPLVEAKMNYYKRQGSDPFAVYQCPQAVIALKQGVGRLIRDKTDKGILIIADPRLTTRAYGRLFFASLPPMRITRQLKKVELFIQQGMSHELVSA